MKEVVESEEEAEEEEERCQCVNSEVYLGRLQGAQI